MYILALTGRSESGMLTGKSVESRKGECMADLDAVLEQLKQERKRAEGELKQLGKVITVLSKMKTTVSGSGKAVKRQLSAAARERIAAAQRARWAKVRAQSRKTS